MSCAAPHQPHFPKLAAPHLAQLPKCSVSLLADKPQTSKACCSTHHRATFGSRHHKHSGQSFQAQPAQPSCISTFVDVLGPAPQGICFLGKVKFPEFVKEHLGEWPGLIVEDEEQSEPAASSSNSSGSPDAAAGVPAGGNGVGGKERKGVTEKGAHGAASGSGEQKGVTEKNVHKAASESGSGRGGRAPTVAMFGRRRVLGAHAGYWFYTVGQRGGIKLPGGPWCAAHVLWPFSDALFLVI